MCEWRSKQFSRYVCKVDPLPQSHHCIFHHSGEKDVSEFVSELTKQMARGNYNFTGYVFPIGITNTQRGTSIQQGVRLPDEIPELSLFEATVHGPIDLEGARILGALNLAHARVDGDIKINKAWVAGEVILNSLLAGGEIVLSDTTAGDILQFCHGVTKRNFYIVRTRISNTTWIHHARIEGSAWFGGLKVDASLSLMGSSIKGYAGLWDMQIKGGADFTHMEVGGAANFHDSQFFGGANFSSSAFSGGVGFSKALINKYAKFENTDFGKGAYFGNCEVKGALIFSSCMGESIGLGEERPTILWFAHNRLGLRIKAPEGQASFWEFAKLRLAKEGKRERADAAYYFERLYRVSPRAATLRPKSIPSDDYFNEDFMRRFRRRRRMELIAKKAFTAIFRWLPDCLLLRWPTAYGASVSRLFTTWGVIVGAFAATYHLVGASLFASASTGLAWPLSFGRALYFSIITFTTLGYGDIKPTPGWGSALCATEAILGGIMMALTVLVIGRKFMR